MVFCHQIPPPSPQGRGQDQLNIVLQDHFSDHTKSGEAICSGFQEKRILTENFFGTLAIRMSDFTWLSLIKASINYGRVRILFYIK